MKKGQTMKRTTGYWMKIWLPVVLMALLLAGCKSVKYVPVTEYRDRYVSRTDTMLRVDSVYLHDSVSVMMRGDTVFTTKTRYKDRLKYVYNTKTDTVAVHDSIPYPVKVEVERKETWLEKAAGMAGKAALALCAVLAVLVAYNLLRRH